MKFWRHKSKKKKFDLWMSASKEQGVWRAGILNFPISTVAASFNQVCENMDKDILNFFEGKTKADIRKGIELDTKRQARNNMLWRNQAVLKGHDSLYKAVIFDEEGKFLRLEER